MHLRSNRLPLLVTLAALSLWALAPLAASAGPPTSFPLGHHGHDFQTSGSRVPASGFDPAFYPGDQSDKNALIDALAANGYSTYPVGLPQGEEPSDLPRRWTLSGTIDEGDLANAGFPTIQLTGVSGPVYHIDGYTNCSGDGRTGCPNLTLGGNLKVVISRSAFGSITATSGSPEVWIVDSLVDAVNDQPGGLKCQSCDRLYVMYSEILGGDDSCKLYSNQHLYRTHIHAPELQGSEHADGCQCSGPCQNIFLVETNMDFLFRKPNAGYWMETTFGPAGPVYHFRNLLAGGQNPTRIVRKVAGSPWVDEAVYKDNVYLGVGSNVSWTTAEFVDASGTYPITEHASGNIRVDGAPVGFGNAPVTAAEIGAVDSVVGQMTLWVQEIRAASSSSGGSGPPSGDDRLVPPFLFD